MVKHASVRLVLEQAPPLKSSLKMLQNGIIASTNKKCAKPSVTGSKATML